MSKNRKIGIAIWFIAFAVSVFLLFIIPDHYTNNIFATLVFDGIAFISQLILWLKLFRDTKTPQDIFYSSPTFTISTAYLVVQFLICVIEGLLTDVLLFKTTLILNCIVMAIMWALILATFGSKNHAQRIDSRQKNHHVEL